QSLGPIVSLARHLQARFAQQFLGSRRGASDIQDGQSCSQKHRSRYSRENPPKSPRHDLVIAGDRVAAVNRSERPPDPETRRAADTVVTAEDIIADVTYGTIGHQHLHATGMKTVGRKNTPGTAVVVAKSATGARWTIGGQDRRYGAP